MILVEYICNITSDIGPDCLESNILKITGKISISNHLELVSLKIVNVLFVICQNNKKKIDYFPK